MQMNPSHKKPRIGAAILALAVAVLIAPAGSLVAQTAVTLSAAQKENEAVAAAVGDVAVGAASKAVVPNDNSPDIVFGGDALPVMEIKEKNTTLPKVRSLFFSAQDMASIRKSVGIYTRVISGEGDDPLDVLRRLQGGDEKPKQVMRYFVYPQFYLASLVYHSYDDWSVYINNQKLTNKQPESTERIRVLAIDKDTVTFEWLPPDLQRVEEVWNVSPNDEIQVDIKQGRVVFTLRPNQTFSSYVMRILEGKVVPMVIDLSPKSKDGKDGKPSVDGKKTTSGGRAANEHDFLDNLLGGR